uniref:Leucine-rich repeat-containing N-terminal plant-type domain-containing protein n=1 Tax=Ananas comosus var. bracteatus TaxID=296719 RepID=A0A6V7NRG0_ANACO|nr:unnamed protein product [Ananas comosus var. bracteatus]
MGNRVLPCFFYLLLLLRFAPLSCSQSQQSCDSSDLNALQDFVEGLQSSDLGWSFNESSSSSDCCTWVGISCDLGSVSVKRVIGLDLSNKSLKALSLLLWVYEHVIWTYPVESNLPSIRLFNISANSFRGTHPIFAGSSNLSVYDVSSNSFSGPVDTGICNSSDSIQVLRFSANMLSGEFPVGFGNCSSLSKLSLDANGLTGTLPDDLFTLSSLTKLNFQGNSLSGTVKAPQPRNEFLFRSYPFRSSQLLADAELKSWWNNLVGKIPSSFRNFTSLAMLGLYVNNFSNLFSALQILQSLPNLTYVLLDENFRDSELMPSEGIQGFANTEFLSISDCSLSGSIPPWLANLTKLKSLDISSNYLSGRIPSWLGILMLSFTWTSLVICSPEKFLLA